MTLTHLLILATLFAFFLLVGLLVYRWECHQAARHKERVAMLEFFETMALDKTMTRDALKSLRGQVQDYAKEHGACNRLNIVLTYVYGRLNPPAS